MEMLLSERLVREIAFVSFIHGTGRTGHTDSDIADPI